MTCWTKDRPFTDLHNTEGHGEFPDPFFFARPVVGGHFAFLTLGNACGGKAMEGLEFLDADDKDAHADANGLQSGSGSGAT